MSWENMSSEQYPCPCGKSTYTVTSRMDDWNHTGTSLQMDCKECGENYVLYSESSYRSGMPSTSQFWISKETHTKCRQMKDEAKALRKKTTMLKAERLLPKWMALFEGKNKKRSWEILTDNGARYPALGTFYKHTKEEGMDAYLLRHFQQADDRGFEIILATLGIDDQEISELIQKAQELEKAARTLAWKEKFPE